MAVKEIPDRPSTAVLAGVDVGKAHDPTVLTISRPFQEWTGRMIHVGHEEGWGECSPYCRPVFRWVHDVRGIRSLPLRMDYPEQARKTLGLIEKVLGRAEVRRVVVLVDATGVGASLVDALREEIVEQGVQGVTVVPVTIGAGGPEKVDGNLHASRVHASGAALMSRLKSKAQSGRIRLAKGREREQLVAELAALEYDVTETGHLKFGAAPGEHDDRVYSLALCTLFDPPGEVLSEPSEIFA